MSYGFISRYVGRRPWITWLINIGIICRLRNICVAAPLTFRSPFVTRQLALQAALALFFTDLFYSDTYRQVAL